MMPDEMQLCYNYERRKNTELSQRVEKLVKGLKEIRSNLRCIDGPNEADEYINDALNIAINLLKECGADE